MKQNQKLLVLAPALYTYVRNDIMMLSQKYHVQSFIIEAKPNFKFLKLNFEVLLYLIQNKNKLHQAIFWFADYYGLAPFLFCKVLGINTIVIAGGYDTVSFPDIPYGAHIQGFRSRCIKFMFQKCNAVVAVSKYVAHILTSQHQVKPAHVHTISNVTSPYFYNLDTKRLFESERQYMGICVSNVTDWRSYNVKGIDRFIDMAKCNPLEKFVWIGGKQDFISQITHLPSNLKVLPFCTQDILLSYYMNSVYVIQLSRFESFGIAVLEGVLCGCIPIVSAFTGCAELSEHHPYGLLVEPKSETFQLEKLKTNDVMQDIISKAIHTYQNVYSIKKREELLYRLLS